MKIYKAHKYAIRGIAVTLPSKWAKGNNIKPGDNLKVIINPDNSITIKQV